jgi:hypothetical protein
MLYSALAAIALVLMSQQPATWRLVPSARIGDVDGPSSLTQITDLALDSAGNIYVLSARDASVKVFGSNGSLLRVIGRRGAGPGELDQPWRIGFRQNRLWVADPSQLRITFFNPRDGSVTGTVRLPPAPTPRFGRPHPFGLLSDSSFVAAFYGTSNSTAEEVLPIIYQHARGQPRTLTSFNFKHLTLAIRDPHTPSNGFFGPQPFDDSPIILYSQRAGQVVAVRRDTDRSGYSLTWINPLDGSVVRAREYSITPIRIPKAVADSAIGHQVDVIVKHRILGISSRPEAEHRVREAMFLPQNYPPVKSGFVDQLGRVWLRREATRTQSHNYDIIDAEGRVIARTSVPNTVTLLVASSTMVWGSIRDELGVPYVQAFVLR